MFRKINIMKPTLLNKYLRRYDLQTAQGLTYEFGNTNAVNLLPYSIILSTFLTTLRAYRKTRSTKQGSATNVLHIPQF